MADSIEWQLWMTPLKLSVKNEADCSISNSSTVRQENQEGIMLSRVCIFSSV